MEVFDVAKSVSIPITLCHTASDKKVIALQTGGRGSQGVSSSKLNFLIYEENLIFFFISVQTGGLNGGGGGRVWSSNFMQVSSMAASQKTTAFGTPDIAATFRSIADGSFAEDDGIWDS